jgi:hypothetical protein
METPKQDIDKSVLAATVLAKALILGKKVYADKTIDVKDLQHAPEAVELLKSAVEVGVAYKEVGEELGDLDSTEILALVAKAIELVKEVEQA